MLRHFKEKGIILNFICMFKRRLCEWMCLCFIVDGCGYEYSVDTPTYTFK